MPKLAFEHFIICFRKQFIFGNKHVSRYYTTENYEQKLKNDQWGIMAFIHTGTLYGFSDAEMLEELQIAPSLYEVLKEEVVNVVNRKYHDQNLHKKVITKVGLVKNCVRYTHRVKL